MHILLLQNKSSAYKSYLNTRNISSFSEPQGISFSRCFLSSLFFSYRFLSSSSSISNDEFARKYAVQSIQKLPLVRFTDPSFFMNAVKLLFIVTERLNLIYLTLYMFQTLTSYSKPPDGR